MARATGWLRRFGEGHGGPPDAVALGDGRVRVRAPDGARADWQVPGVDLAAGARPGDPLDPEVLLGRVGAPRTAAVLLLRRGGAVVAVVQVDADGARVLEALVRTAYVQSRTAAGGWSQQRYARRRAGQSAGLARDAASAAGRVWSPHLGALRGPSGLLATAGDRALLDVALAELPAALAPVTALPRQELELRGDPRRRVLDALAPLVGAVRVAVHDPPPAAGTAPRRDGLPAEGPRRPAGPGA